MNAHQQPRRIVRPISNEELARILGEIDEAEAVRGDDLIYRHDWGVELDPVVRHPRLAAFVRIFAISLSIGIVAYFGAQFVRGAL